MLTFCVVVQNEPDSRTRTNGGMRKVRQPVARTGIKHRPDKQGRVSCCTHLEVERRVDLIHKIQRRRLEVVQCEDQRQRAQRLLTTGQV